jgi:hypothetical protein
MEPPFDVFSKIERVIRNAKDGTVSSFIGATSFQRLPGEHGCTNKSKNPPPTKIVEGGDFEH